MNGFALFMENLIPAVLNIFNRYGVRVTSQEKKQDSDLWRIDFEYDESTDINAVTSAIEKVQNANR